METDPRRVVVSEFLSLDGVMEDPPWTAPYWNDEIAASKGEETSAAEALLLGRVTYEVWKQRPLREKFAEAVLVPIPSQL